MNEDSEDWFDKALREAEESLSAAKARDRAALREVALKEDALTAAKAEIVRRAMAPPPRPREAAKAASIFEAVATGKASPLGAGPDPAWITPRPTGMRAPRPGTPYPRATLEEFVSERTGGRSVTPEQGLEAILEAVREAGNSDDVLRVAGEWITRVTNGISAIVREEDDA